MPHRSKIRIAAFWPLLFYAIFWPAVMVALALNRLFDRVLERPRPGLLIDATGYAVCIGLWYLMAWMAR